MQDGSIMRWKVLSKNIEHLNTLISDQAGVFTGNVFAELLDSWNVKPRFGAVGKHGSISVTERVIKTLKYEWLKRVPIIKGFDHLTMLSEEFENCLLSKRNLS